MLKIFVGGDWDLDGIVSTALIVYAQEKLKVYPINADVVVEKKPLDPERIKYIFNDLKGVYEYMVLLDLPYTERVGSILNLAKRHFNVKRIMYIDHHLSTLHNLEKLKKIVDTVIVDHRKASAELIYELLVKNNIKVPDRIRSFIEVVKYMDTGRKIPQDMLRLFDYLRSIAKIVMYTRDENIWIRVVDWLSSPIASSSPFDNRVFEKYVKVVEERDREIEDKAMDFALSAVKIGCFNFIDARGRWKQHASSVLVSKIASILKNPVIVWFDTNKTYSILIVKASGGRAYRVAKQLYSDGLAIDIGGHANLAVVKIPRNVDQKALMDALRRISVLI